MLDSNLDWKETMTIIFCDEAGNTGEHLLDPNQRGFVLASNDFSEEEASTLLGHVRSSQGGEAKIATLKKTNAGIDRLGALLHDPRLNGTRIATLIFDKKFMVYTKLVDLIMETLMHEAGQDIYEMGANLSLSNLLYYSTPILCHEAQADIMLQAFVHLLRKRNKESVEEYLKAGDLLLQTCSNDQFAALLAPFFSPTLLPIWYDQMIPLSIEPAIPALFATIVEWGRRKDNRFSVYHDHSKPVLATADDFEKMCAGVDEASDTVGYDRRKFQFPLRATELRQVDSKDYSQIQIADICAGVIWHYFRCKTQRITDPLCDLIERAGSFGWISGGVIPSPSFTADALDIHDKSGKNPISAFAERMSRLRRKVISKW